MPLTNPKIVPESNNKPVIFLAFANDRDDNVGYLRNLPVEARKLREVLERAEQAGLCEAVIRSNSTAGDIFKVFQEPRYRNRVAVFHYAGHANGYQLLLESPDGKAAAADARGRGPAQSRAPRWSGRGSRFSPPARRPWRSRRG